MMVKVNGSLQETGAKGYSLLSQVIVLSVE
jgi:hypothetical protein